MKTAKSLILIAALSAPMATATTAYAGGLFGNGGLIRGSVGEFFDKNLEKPILTPTARAGAVAAGTALGTYGGSFVGAPQIGGAIGAQIGQGINDAARGSNFNASRTQQPLRQPVQPRNLHPRQQMANVCHTPYGRSVPGPFAPVGSPCNMIVNGFPVAGYVSW